MNSFLEKLSDMVKGYMVGFDRIVFKGLVLPLAYASGAMGFCRSKGILNKDYKAWMMDQSKELVETAENYGKNNVGRGITHLSSWRTRKEDLAHERQQEEKISSGLIGVWSCLESGSSYRAHYCAQTGYPQLRNYQTRCKHLYYYFDHEDFGFMNIRLQTWFPYHVQICLNGREWLRRHLERQGIAFLRQKNKILHISDYQEAQQFLDQQLDTRWVDVLNTFLLSVFPTLKDVLGPHLSYYWTMWQSEWATDILFHTPSSLNSIMDSLLRHAIMTGTSTRVLRYLDRPLLKNGNPRSKDEVASRVLDFNDGIRVRHWVDHNSVKIYNEQNVLRVETTINQPEKFQVYRNKQGEPSSEPKTRLPLRKGVADIALRAKVSQEVNNRYMNNLSAFNNDTPVADLIDDIISPKIKKGRRVRAIDPIGKDREFLKAIADPLFMVSGLTNKMLREKLKGSNWTGNRTDKQMASRISRHLRLLRDHGIIRKLPNQHRYQLTNKGVNISSTLNALLAASTEQLLKMVA